MKDTLLIAKKNGLLTFKRVIEFWEERTHALTGLEITAVDMQGDNGLVGTTEGVYVTRDGGKNWRLESENMDTLHVRWVRVHPSDSRYFFVGTEPANIYTRQVNAKKWKKSEEVARLRDQNGWYMPYSPNPGCVRGFAFYQHRIYASVEVGGLLVSEDYGATWRLVGGSTGKPNKMPEKEQIHPDVHSVEMHPASADLVFAPTGGGFYTSRDGGETWTLKYRCYCRAVWVNPISAMHLVLGPADGVDRGGRIEYSQDGGENWEPLMKNLEEKWTDTMVERFVSDNESIYALLSNGKLLTAKIGDFSWQYFLPGIHNVMMLTFI